MRERTKKRCPINKGNKIKSLLILFGIKRVGLATGIPLHKEANSPPTLTHKSKNLFLLLSISV